MRAQRAQLARASVRTTVPGASYLVAKRTRVLDWGLLPRTNRGGRDLRPLFYYTSSALAHLTPWSLSPFDSTRRASPRFPIPLLFFFLFLFNPLARPGDRVQCWIVDN